MDLSIIIVPWKVKNLVRENLRAIFANTKNISFEVFAVDNNSGDGTVEMIREEFPGVKVIANNYNAGFAKANNQAIKESRGRYILLLNPDMRVLTGTLENMVVWMDKNHNAGVAGCRLINEQGETIRHVRRFPKLVDQLAIVLKIPHFFSSVLDNYLRKDFDYNQDAKVDSVRGSFFMIRKEVVEKIGLLDERYFIWFEEVDYCRRVKEAGRDVMYASGIKCIDHVGKSFSQVKRGVTQLYFRDSMLKYFQKWHPGWQYLVLKIAWPIGIFMAWLGEIFKYKTKVKT